MRSRPRERIAAGELHRGVRLAAAFAVVVLAPAVAAASPGPPTAAPREALEQPWTVVSLAEERGLRRRVAYDVTFEPDGTAWIGASDGLYRYDGYSWKVFTTEHGLPSAHVRAVLWTQKGELWVGTMKGAGVFDGTRFDDRGSMAGYGARSIKKMAEDPDGTLWMWSDTYPAPSQPGGIASYKDGNWRAYHVADGLPVEKVRNYFRSRDGRQLVTTGVGVSEKIGDRWQTVPLPEGAREPWAMAETKDGVVAFGRDDGWYRLSGHAISFEPRRMPLATVNMVLRTRDGQLLVPGVLDTQLALFAWNGSELVQASPILSRQAPWVQSVREAPDGAIWVLGDWGLLIRWQRRGAEWIGYENLPAPAYLDEEGRPVFHGSFDHMLWKRVEGTYRWDGAAFSALPGPAPPERKDAAGLVWTVSGDLVTAVDPRSNAPVHMLTVRATGMARAHALVLDGERTPWLVGVDGRGHIVVTRLEVGVFSPASTVASVVPHNVLAARAGPGAGVYVLAVDEARDLQVFHVGAHVIERHPVGETHDRNVKVHIADLLVDTQNVGWVYGSSDETFLFQVTFGRDGEPARRLTARASRITGAIAVPGATWFTKEPLQGGTDGLLAFRDGRWDEIQTPMWGQGTRGYGDGLVFRDRDRLVLVRGRDGDPRQLSMLPGREPPGSGTGVPLWDRDENVWVIGTDTPRGDSRVMRFRPDGVPPDTVLVEAPPEVRTDGVWRPRAMGVERFVPMKQQRTFRFSYRFDEGPWSRFDQLPSDGFSVRPFALGPHTFELRAEDEGGDVDPSPARATFRVVPIPIEQRGWFKPTVASLFAVMLALALLAVERARKAGRANASLSREMETRRAAEEALRIANDGLEVAVEERTRELRSAHEELSLLHEEAKTRIKNELELAERIQTTLLPRAPAARGLDVACKMLPASEVGGDYYDLLAMPDGAWIGIGDVAGHGLPAGLIMLMVQSALASVVAANPKIGPREALTAVNAVLCENIRRRMGRDEHVTLSLLRYRVDGTVEFSGAHEEIVVWRAARRRCELVETPGAWTGVSLKAAAGFEQNQMDLAVGDLVVLYTDGVIEAENAAGEAFGIERLCGEVEAAADRDVRAVLEHLLAAVRAWAAVQADDASLVVLRHKGEAAAAAAE